MLPRVSVVIVTWNALGHLRRFLPSAVATDYPDLEIVVADNASTDGSADWIAETYPEVTVVRHERNLLFCGGNNRALPHTTGRYIVLLNNDVEVPPDWLHPLVAAMESEPDVAAIQPKILQFDDRSRFEYAGASGGFLDRFGYPFARGRVFSTLEPDRGQYDDARDVFWASGAALMLRRSALDALGEPPLDERFEMHMEEIDLCWRLWRAGYRVRVEPASRVYHLGGGSLPQGSPRKTYYNFRNSFLTLYKNLPSRVFRRIEPQRYALDTLAAAQAVGRPAEVAAIVRAHRDYRRMKRHYTPPPDDAPLVLPPYPGSVALDAFGRGKRTFADLAAFRTMALGTTG